MLYLTVGILDEHMVYDGEAGRRMSVRLLLPESVLNWIYSRFSNLLRQGPMAYRTRPRLRKSIPFHIWPSRSHTQQQRRLLTRSIQTHKFGPGSTRRIVFSDATVFEFLGFVLDVGNQGFEVKRCGGGGASDLPDAEFFGANVVLGDEFGGYGGIDVVVGTEQVGLWGKVLVYVAS